MIRGFGKSKIAFVLAAAVCLLCSVVVLAEDMTVTDLAAALSDDDYRVRQEATTGLLQDNELDLAELASNFDADGSLEHRHRIVDVLRHHLLRRQIEDLDIADRTASVGIGLFGLTDDQTADLERAAIVVRSTYPGFPGYAYLQRDDLIYQVNGRRIPTGLAQRDIQQYCVDLIKKTGVGELIELSVFREGEKLEIVFRLVPYAALGELYQTKKTLRLGPMLKDEQDLLIREQLSKLIPELDELEPERLELEEDGVEVQAVAD